ncbi:DUF2157 domain-containing protein [Demequina gelatinilytica]|uniref:DUF2157 domain-containing protein n=1 Tax=Demequina gelatinilytica TaxID=1638980 RepID=UPI0007846677|nr:DUF2157 domain-containing protein [Demequina gelatinilytica]
MNELETRLGRWVEAGLISPETAADLRRFESAQPQDVEAHPRPLALVGEVVGYLGAVLTVSALAFLLSRTWTDLPTAARIALVAALVAVTATAGVLAARTASAPAQRLASVLLVAAVVLTGWLAWVIGHDAAGVDDEDVGRWVTAAAAAAATAVYLARRRGLTQITLLVALAWCVETFAQPWESDASALALGLPWVILGISWIALAITPLLTPREPALVTGGLLAYAGLSIAARGDARGLMLGLGVAFAAWLIGAAVMRRELVLLIVPGAVALLASVPQLIDHLVGDTLLTWVGVMVSGLALVAVAVWMVRDRQRHEPEEAGAADDDIVLSP